jgi:hypothetical protein
VVQCSGVGKSQFSEKVCTLLYLSILRGIGYLASNSHLLSVISEVIVQSRKIDSLPGVSSVAPSSILFSLPRSAI